MINVCPDFFGHVEKRLHKKEKVNMLRKPVPRYFFKTLLLNCTIRLDYKIFLAPNISGAICATPQTL